jgi:hypothetical protein
MVYTEQSQLPRQLQPQDRLVLNSSLFPVRHLTKSQGGKHNANISTEPEFTYPTSISN